MSDFEAVMSAFAALDDDNDGKITLDQFRTWIRENDIGEEEYLSEVSQQLQ